VTSLTTTVQTSPIIETDVAIIGAGTAGMTAYRAALEHTPRVLVIESGVYGTTCARVGCMPSKLLIAAAEAAHAVTGAARFGITAGPVSIDGRAVMARVRSERDRFVGFVVDAVQGWPEAHRLVGHARFVDNHTLQVGATQVRAQRIVIATGSRPHVPASWRKALGDRLIVNDDVFEWTDLPRSVAVVGAAVIGLELAQALHRLGPVDTTGSHAKVPAGPAGKARGAAQAGAWASRATQHPGPAGTFPSGCHQKRPPLRYEASPGLCVDSLGPVGPNCLTQSWAAGPARPARPTPASFRASLGPFLAGNALASHSVNRP
jgi:Pyridine nucleotide-disulphide oxidoreductase